MSNLILIFKNWIPFAAVITLLCGIIYITVQQSYRMSANDPQYQMVDDAVYAMDNGVDPKTLIPACSIELAHSLSPYLIIYDDKENAVASNALLNGKFPKLPSGVLDYVRKNGEDIISWQPQPGIRQALVIKKTNGNNLYFVAAGRSLIKVEERESMLTKQVAVEWIASLFILFIVVWVSRVTLNVNINPDLKKDR